MVVSRAVRDAVTEVVRSRFIDAKITSVKVDSGKDSDGDPVLNIYIVFESEPGKVTLDGKKMSGLPRQLIETLSALEFDAFPLVSFVSAADAKKLNLEAA